MENLTNNNYKNTWEPLEPPDFNSTKYGFYIGTSGYYFDDWVGIFNPPKFKSKQFNLNIPKEDYDRLLFYQKYFNFVEINSSFYTEPVKQTYIDFVKRSRQNTMFSVKVHQSISHTKEWDIQKATEMMQKQIEAISPLKEAGKFYSFLLQLEDYNQFSVKKLDYLIKVCNIAVKNSLDIHIEFRNKTWHKKYILQKLKDNGIGICNTDLPPFPHVFPLRDYATTQKGYIRYSGRNIINWYQKEKAKTYKERIQQRNKRYDYFYSDKEINDNIKGQISLKQKTKETAIAYNNHFKASAIINALKNIKLLKEKLNIN